MTDAARTPAKPVPSAPPAATVEKTKVTAIKLLAGATVKTTKPSEAEPKMSQGFTLDEDKEVKVKSVSPDSVAGYIEFVVDGSSFDGVDAGATLYVFGPHQKFEFVMG